MYLDHEDGYVCLQCARPARQTRQLTIPTLGREGHHYSPKVTKL